MLYPIKNVEDLEKLEELASLQNQVNEVRLQDKLGKQNYHYEIKKLQEPTTDAIKNASKNIAKTLTETSKENNLALENLNTKLLEIMNAVSYTHLTLPTKRIV